MTTSRPSLPRRISKHLTRNAVAWLALFVALSGTSYAVTMISGSQIKDGSLTVKDLAKGVTSAPARTINLPADSTPPPYAETTVAGGAGSSLKFTTTRAGKVLLLSPSGAPLMTFKSSDASIDGVAGIYIDKKPIAGTKGRMSWFFDIGTATEQLGGMVVQLAAGSHTIELRYKVTGGAVTETNGYVNAVSVIELG